MIDKRIWLIIPVILLLVVAVAAIYSLSTGKSPTALLTSEREIIKSGNANANSLSYNGHTLDDMTVYSGEACSAQYSGMLVQLPQCDAKGWTMDHIEQIVNFTWTGSRQINVTYVFVYEGKLINGNVGLWINETYDYPATEVQNTWINNYLVNGVFSYQDIGTPTSECDVGNTNNTKMYNVTKRVYEPNNASNYTNFTQQYCFTTVTPVNATAFRISGNYDNYVEVTKTTTGYHYRDVTDKFEYLGNGLLGDNRSYYKVDNMKFSPGQSYYTKWQYIPKDYASSGKWHIFGYETEYGMLQSILDGRYLYMDPTWSATSLGLNLSAYWSFNETSGTNIYDSVNHFNGTTSGSPIFQAGLLANAINLSGSGTNQYINFGDGSQIINPGTNTTSISMWIRPTAFSADGYMFLAELTEPPSTDKFIFYFNGATTIGCGFRGTGTFAQYTLSASDYFNRWTHLVCTYNGGAKNSATSYSLYVNGTLYTTGKTTISVGGNTTHTHNYIGVDNDGSSADFIGKIDEVAVWKRLINSSDVTALYNGGLGYGYTIGDTTTLTMDLPPTVLTNATVFFNWSITSSGSVNNWTFYLWNATGALNYTNFTTVTPASFVQGNITLTLPSQVSYTWNVEGCSATACVTGTNKTLFIDTAAPLVTINYPSNNQIVTNSSFNMTYTILDSNVSSCWYTNSSGVNVTTNCYINTTLINIGFGTEAQIILYANDTGNQLGYARVNYTAVNITTSYANQSFAAKSFDTETKSYTYFIHKSPNVTAVPTLYYNGSAATNYTELSNGLFNVTYTIPALPLTIPNASINFYWNWTMSYNGNTGQSFTSMVMNSTQELYQILMNACTGIYTQRIINLTFIDEGLGTRTNATLDSSSWTYAAGIGQGVNKTFSFSNVTGHNFEYDFCIYPSFAPSVLVTSIIQASKSDTGTYPQRKYNIFGQTYLNTTMENISMYLLNYNNGITSSYQVITIGNQVIPSAYVKVERSIAGVTVKVADGYTDSSGIITFFLSPNYEHTITVTKTGYSNQVATIYPTQGIYTITMGGSSSFFYYNNSLEGVTWTKYPPSGIVTFGVYNYTFKVNSRNIIIYNCSLSIRFPNGTIVGSAVGCNTSPPNTGGSVGVMVNTTKIGTYNVSRLYGTYIIGLVNSSYIVETDANWRIYNGTYTDYTGTFRSAINDSINLPEWGDNPATTDFSRIVFFFLMMAILLAILNFFTGYDTAYPGAFIYIMTLVVLLLSAVNGVNGPGFFYLEGATTFGGTDFSPLFNNWILAVHFVLLSAIYFFTTNKRYQAG